LIYRRHDTNMTNDQQTVRAGVFDILRHKLVRARNSMPEA
jgi:hypothetical protein